MHDDFHGLKSLKMTPKDTEVLLKSNRKPCSKVENIPKNNGTFMIARRPSIGASPLTPFSKMHEEKEEIDQCYQLLSHTFL